MVGDMQPIKALGAPKHEVSHDVPDPTTNMHPYIIRRTRPARHVTLMLYEMASYYDPYIRVMTKPMQVYNIMALQW